MVRRRGLTLGGGRGRRRGWARVSKRSGNSALQPLCSAVAGLRGWMGTRLMRTGGAGADRCCSPCSATATLLRRVTNRVGPSSMFGCIVAGRLVPLRTARALTVCRCRQTCRPSRQQSFSSSSIPPSTRPPPTATLSSFSPVHPHPRPRPLQPIVGERLFDLGLGASVYHSVPSAAEHSQAWRFLGVLTNEKASAVFRLTHPPSSSTQNALPFQIGISIEPLSVLDQLTASSTSTALIPVPASHPDSAIAIAQRIGESVFNYVVSFARSATTVAQAEPDLQVVPVRTVQDWFNNLVRRATVDPESFMRLVRPDPPPPAR